MSRSSGRGQTEPLAAVVAVLAVVAVVGVYATVYAHALPDPDRPAPTATLDRVANALTAGGVAHPRCLAGLTGPRGVAVNATLRAANRTWKHGPNPPDRAPTAARDIAVRTGGHVVAGRLRVVVWS